MTARPKIFSHPSEWKLQDAKAQLSALVRQAQDHGPQTVTVHGKPAVVVVDAREWLRLKPQKSKLNLAESKKPKVSFIELMRSSPFVGLELDFERLRDPVRTINLDEQLTAQLNA